MGGQARSPPEGRGREAGQGLEGPAEGFEGFVSGLEGQVRDRPTGVAQGAGGPLQPQAADVVHEGLAEHALEDAVEMGGRKEGLGGQALQGQGLVQALLDEDQHPGHAFVIDGMGGLFHGVAAPGKEGVARARGKGLTETAIFGG